jgi:hypothetical protein
MGLAAVLGQSNFEFQNLIEFKTEFENSLGYESSVYVGSFHKKQRSVISCYCHFKCPYKNTCWV